MPEHLAECSHSAIRRCFAQLAQHAPIGMALVTLSGTWVQVNPALCSLIGRKASDLIGRPVTEALDPTTDIEALHHTLRAGHPQASANLTARHLSGASIALHAQAWLAGDTQQPLALYHIQDASWRTRMQTALTEREQRFQAIFDHTFQFIGLLDTAGTVLEANHTALQFGGLCHADVIGRPFWEARWWTLSGAVQARLRAAISQAAAGEFVRYDEEVRGAGSRTATIDFSLTPVRNERGDVVLLVPEGRDVTEQRHIELALRDSTERFHQAFSYAAIGMALVGLDGRFLQVNPALCQLVGYSEAELLAGSFQEITHPDDLAADLAYADRLRAGMIPSYSLEKRYLHKDGRTVWILLTGSVVRRPDGEPLYFIAQIQDISQQKDMLLALRASEQRLQQVISATPVIIWAIDGDGLITLMEGRGLAPLGLTPGQFIGAPLAAWDEAPSSLLEAMRQALGGVHAICRASVRDLTLELHTSPVRNGHQAVDGAICVAVDVTERERAAATFQGLVESAPDAMIIIDATGRMVLVNEQTERIFGYLRSDLLGQPVELLVPTASASAHQLQRAAYVAQPAARAMGGGRRLFGQRRDGSTFAAEISLSPLRLPQGLLITAVVRDITPRLEAEARLTASLAEKEVLLKEIHHRVKNNMQIIASLLKWQADRSDHPEVRALLRDSQTRLRSMALVHERLYQAETLAHIDFAQYVERLVHYLLRVYHHPAGRIATEIDIRLSRLDIDRALYLGLLINELVSNSLKHAFDGRAAGVIRITADQQPPTMLTLEVGDDGRGMPSPLPDSAEHIGLRLIHTLAQQLKGTATFDTSAGTAFRLVMPLEKE